MIEETLTEIQDECLHILTSEQLQFIRARIASYGLACVMDSRIRNEAEAVCQEEVNGQ